MKMTLLKVIGSWLCGTGVAVISTYFIATSFQGTARDQAVARHVAERIARRGTIQEYKPATRHSSAVKKTTSATVAGVINKPVYVDNPIYVPFTNAVARLSSELADMAKDNDVKLDNGFMLTSTNGMPFIKFPEEYAKVEIGGVAIGDVLDGGTYSVQKAKVEGENQEKIDGVSLCKFRRLDEPEFYCTKVWYSIFPSTKQVDSIRMHGDLCVGDASKANRMVREISRWIKDDFNASERRADVPDGTLALKKFKIGDAMDVEVTVKWKNQRADDGSDAYIDINFTPNEMIDDNRFECQELGEAADAARLDEYRKSGVNYFTVRPRVSEDEVKRKVVH